MKDMWEYKVVIPSMNAKEQEFGLNTMGIDGWELVSVVMGPSGFYFYFKKRI